MHKDEVKTNAFEGKDGATMDEWDPWNPPCPRDPIPSTLDLMSHAKLVGEWFDKKNELTATSRATNIIIPNRLPESVNDAFYDVLPHLVPIFRKDSVRCFFRLLERGHNGLAWGFIIHPLTFNQMVMQNALRCAKVVLEGKAPELGGFRANPNCMNVYGYLPLHQAAERFSVDMIRLLLRYNASANLRTTGAHVIENLLPLHVAVENTCLHKYLEDNAFPNHEDLDNNQANINYMCKLIHLLCLPEMKIFLDTTRLLAGHTNNLVDELWNYIVDGKLVQTAVLLLAAQKDIRMGSSCKNSNNKPDGFTIIINRILNHTIALELEAGKSRKKNKELEMKKKLTRTALLLVHTISQAGDALDAYIQSYPEVPLNLQVPHEEVRERLSSILKDYGLCPTAEGINIGTLCPYENVLSKEELPNRYGDMIGVNNKETSFHLAELKKSVRNTAASRGWELKYARRSFFPYWRSVLSSRLPVKVIRANDPRSLEQLQSFRKSVSARQGSYRIPTLSLSRGKDKQLLNQPRKMFCSAALLLLKVFRNA